MGKLFLRRVSVTMMRRSLIMISWMISLGATDQAETSLRMPNLTKSPWTSLSFSLPGAMRSIRGS